MSISNDIRAALVTALKAVSGLPAVADEGGKYDPVVGTAFVDFSLTHTANRINTMGDDHLYKLVGMLMVTCVYPAKNGIKAPETMADSIRAAFNPSTPLTSGATTIRIQYAERLPHEIDADWIRVPVAVEWFLFTETP